MMPPKATLGLSCRARYSLDDGGGLPKGAE